MKNKLVLKGKVKSGKGHFSWVMKNISGLWDLYKQKSGLTIFPGTLNVELAEDFSIPQNSKRIEASEYGGTVSVSFCECEIEKIKGLIIRTDKNESGKGDHPKTIIEIAAEENLRKELNLEDGDEVQILVEM
jgi:riboflavin kinase, archaea type